MHPSLWRCGWCFSWIPAGDFHYCGANAPSMVAETGEQRLRSAMRAMARFMTWVEMEAEATEFWSDIDDDGNEVPRYKVCDGCGSYDRPELLLRALNEGKLRLGWGDEIGGRGMSIEVMREEAIKASDRKQRNNLLCRMAGNIMAGMYGNPRTLDFTKPTGINFPGLIPNEELARQAVDLARAIIAEVERG